jgi:hypothetical protein
MNKIADNQIIIYAPSVLIRILKYTYCYFPAGRLKAFIFFVLFLK